jgi:MoaA/NifB/PqqE/SkfB family radical SAM enzyme
LVVAYGLAARGSWVASSSDEARAVTYKAYAVSWNLTQRGNLFCAHCFISAAPGASAAGELSTDECRRVLADMARRTFRDRHPDGPFIDVR